MGVPVQPVLVLEKIDENLFLYDVQCSMLRHSSTEESKVSSQGASVGGWIWVLGGGCWQWWLYGRYILDCCARRGNQLKLPACAPARDLKVNEARGRGAGERRRRQRALRAQEEGRNIRRRRGGVKICPTDPICETLRLSSGDIEGQGNM